MKILITPVVELIRKPIPEYVDVGLLGLLEKEAFLGPFLLNGPKGTGKTMAVQQYCAINKYPLVRFDCTEWTHVRDLQGTISADEDGNYIFSTGAVTLVIETAKRYGRTVGLFDELLAMNPNAQKALNGITDFRQAIDIQKIGQVFKLPDPVYSPVSGEVVSVDEGADCTYISIDDGDISSELEVVEVEKDLGVVVGMGQRIKEGDLLTVVPEIWIVGTSNPATYGGNHEMNECLSSRFSGYDIGYPPVEHETKILLEVCGPKPSESDRDLVRKLILLATETRAGGFKIKDEQTGKVKQVKAGYALSTRELAVFIKRFRKTSLFHALKILENKFKGEARKNYRCAAKRIFDNKMDLGSMCLIYGHVKPQHKAIQ